MRNRKLANRVIKQHEGKDPKWYSKLADILDTVSDEEAQRSQFYLLSDGGEEQGEDAKDLEVPYWMTEDGVKPFMHGTGNQNLEFWNEFLKIQGAEDFIEANWKFSLGESGGMMPHGDAGVPDGAVAMLFAGDDSEPDLQVELENWWNIKDVQKLAKKEKFNINDFARFFLNGGLDYMKPKYTEEDIKKAKKESDVERMELNGYGRVQVVYSVYVNKKDLDKFIKDSKDQIVKKQWLSEIEDNGE